MAIDPAHALTTLGNAAYEAASALPNAGDFVEDDEPRGEPRRESRDPKVARSISFWAPTAACRALRHLAIDEDATTEKLMCEALNLLFASRAMPQIATRSPFSAGRSSEEVSSE